MSEENKNREEDKMEKSSEVSSQGAERSVVCVSCVRVQGGEKRASIYLKDITRRSPLSNASLLLLLVALPATRPRAKKTPSRSHPSTPLT